MEFISLAKQSDLAENIAKGFGKQLIYPSIDRFSDGELQVRFEQPEQFQGERVVLIQSTSNPVHENILLVAFCTQLLKQAGVQEVVGVLPYFGYSRHDKSSISGKPGSIEVIIKLLESAGLDHLITIALHEPHVLDLFSIPVHNINPSSLIAHTIKQNFDDLQNACLVAPDQGAQQQVKKIADMLGIGHIVYEKERFGIDQTRIIGKTIGCVGNDAILIDDIIDTGGTAISVANELVETGFKHVYGYFVHPVLSGNMIEKLQSSPFDTVYLSNTIGLPHDQHIDKLKAFDVAQLFITVLEGVL